LSPLVSPAPGEAEFAHWTDDRQDAFVLGMLLECDDDFVSGSVLCDKLDVPRAELLKRSAPSAHAPLQFRTCNIGQRIPMFEFAGARPATHQSRDIASFESGGAGAIEKDCVSFDLQGRERTIQLQRFRHRKRLYPPLFPRCSMSNRRFFPCQVK